MKNKPIYQVSQLTHFEMMQRLIIQVSSNFFDIGFDDVDFEDVYKKFANTDSLDKYDAKIVDMLTRDQVIKHIDRLKYLANISKHTADFLGETMSLPKADDRTYVIGSARKHYGSILQLLQILHEFDAVGKKMFRVEEQLQNELFMTDVLKVDDTFIHLPFTTICLYLPYNTTMRVYGQLVRYVYVSELDGDNDCRLLEVFAITDNELHHRHVYTLNGGDIESQLKMQIGELYSTSIMAKTENIKLVSFVIATLLYVNTVDSDQTLVSPSVVMPGKHSKLPMCSLGRHIKIQRGMGGMSVSTDGVSNERMIYVLKWTVRGHFHRYKVGQNRSESKTLWIRPFLKGREKDADINAKPSDYIIK